MTHKCRLGQEVDLDDPEFYKELESNPIYDKILKIPNPWKINKTTQQLFDWAWNDMGKSLFYMQYFSPNSGFNEQAKRVDKMCKQFVKEYKKHMKDTEKNRLWFKKFIFLFKDEVENQC